MKTKIIPIAVLCFALAACGNNSRERQNQSAQQQEYPVDEPTMTEPRAIGAPEEKFEESEDSSLSDTLQFIENYDTGEGFYEFFLTKDFAILKMSPAEDHFKDEDKNKLFIISWLESKYPDGRKERYLGNREELSGAEPYMIRRHYSQEDTYTNIYEDTYKNKTLKEVYGIISRNESNFNDHLRKKLPSGNTDYKSDERGDEVEITYRFKTKKHLIIRLSYPGGETSVEITENAKNTTSKITYSTD